ncbi:hypothetical protein QKQ25_gp121 [Hyphantria cunea granulovirus]|uniref:Uncharacterized protein n=1 Tax=Hyphantria cunea granulovirus TaxID=307448 RepID=A0AAF1D2B6_9BBAC|nr:hypothetical protein QKQ25_gp121 [Hyphantria cunea granulovirus]QBQ01674.1 hypothetical protein HycuGV_00121 [Hyphantria cunea granulovirus]
MVSDTLILVMYCTKIKKRYTINISDARLKSDSYKLFIVELQQLLPHFNDVYYLTPFNCVVNDPVYIHSIPHTASIQVLLHLNAPTMEPSQNVQKMSMLTQKMKLELQASVRRGMLTCYETTRTGKYYTPKSNKENVESRSSQHPR